MYYFSICCIAKNEDPYIEEWVNFHRAVGVEHFYIYDNGSTNPIKNLLHRYIAAGIVDVIDFPGKLMQMPAYQHCLDNFGTLSKWVMFCDADEFLVPKSKNDIKDIMPEYEKYGGLVAHWLFFGSGGLVSKPEGLITENFIWSSDKDWCLNNHVKSIVQPEKTLSTGDPHYFQYKPGFFAVNENHEKVLGSISFKCKDCWTPGIGEGHLCGNVPTSKLQVHHYYTKSKQEFDIRYHGGSCYATAEKRSSQEGFESLTRICNVESKEALRFVEKTKESYL